MENKYYTPEIEEFHVGFECEKMIPHTNGGHQISLVNTDQKPFIVRDVFDIPRDRATLSWFRVKYLDKKDIESLGWKLVWNEKSLTFQLGKYILDFWYSTLQLQIVHGDANIIFKGCIKNKSELKRIMKQLKIVQ